MTLKGSLLIKMQFYRRAVRFRTSFGGRERRAVTENQGERIQCLYTTQKREGPAVMLFSLEGGNVKYSIIGGRA